MEYTILPEQFDAVVREAEGKLPDIGQKEADVTASAEQLRDAAIHPDLYAALHRAGLEALGLRMGAIDSAAMQCISHADGARHEYVRGDHEMAAGADAAPKGGR